MIEVDFDTFHASFDDYLDRVENGATFLVRLEDGRGVVCAPAGEIEPILEENDWIQIYSL